jgi:regulator of cell morphogenesis and NO signaling
MNPNPNHATLDAAQGRDHPLRYPAPMNRTTNTASPSAPPFTPETTVGAIVAQRPALARIFEKLGIDYCCGGKKPLAELALARGLDPVTVLAMLDAASLDAGAPEIDAASLTLTQLADHIEQTHHDYVKAELPRLVEMADRVARKHAWRDDRLKEIAETVTVLANQMFSHMAKEERILFPFIRQLEAGAAESFHCGSIANPIRQMEDEHEFAGRAVARLRELTDGFRPDENACNTHRALLGGLEEFESDLHRHVHKENNILFPRALALAAGRN